MPPENRHPRTRLAPPASDGDPAAAPDGRGLLRFAQATSLSESGSYATLAPMLPALAAELKLSQGAAGLLGAAYPAGMVLAAVPAGIAADRIGARTTARVGLAAVAVAMVAFGIGGSGAVIDGARVVQGAGASAAWAGALTWVTRVLPGERRGTALASVLMAAFAGTVAGPVIGVLGGSVGRPEIFLPLAVAVAAVAIWGGPDEDRGFEAGSIGARGLLSAGRDPLIASVMALMVLVGVLLGGIQTLGALLLGARGLGAGAIALAFIAGYASQIVLAPFSGRQIDRAGPRRAISISLTVALVTLLLTPLPGPSWLAAFMIAIETSAAAASYPAVAVLISQVADHRGAEQGLPMALANGSWGVGAALGALALSLVAEARGNFAAFSLVAALCLLALLTLSSRAVRSRLDLDRLGTTPR